MLDNKSKYIYFLNHNKEALILVTSMTTLWAPFWVQYQVSTACPASNEKICRTTETNPNGKNYNYFEQLLETVKFNARLLLFPKDSISAVFMSPIGLYVKSRRSQRCIWTVRLSAPDVFTNIIFEFVLSNVFVGSLAGFECVDGFGKKVCVYEDITSSIGDNPASSAVIAVSEPKFIAPCTHFSYLLSWSLMTSTYAHTTAVQYSN